MFMFDDSCVNDDGDDNNRVSDEHCDSDDRS